MDIMNLYRKGICRASSVIHFSGDPMGEKIRRLLQGEDGAVLCDSCVAELTKRDWEGRKQIWRNLPIFTRVQ